MVFMPDSERAAGLVHEANLDVGLHLHFTEPFTSASCSTGLADAQRRVARFLRRNSEFLLLAGTASVELIMTHPTLKFEREFLMSDAFPPMLRGLDIGSYRQL